MLYCKCTCRSDRAISSARVVDVIRPVYHLSERAAIVHRDDPLQAKARERRVSIITQLFLGLVGSFVAVSCCGWGLGVKPYD